jgi:hypothetical protein
MTRQQARTKYLQRAEKAEDHDVDHHRGFFNPQPAPQFFCHGDQRLQQLWR